MAAFLRRTVYQLCMWRLLNYICHAKMNYRRGHINDAEKLRQLGIEAWSVFKNELTTENWQLLFDSLNNITIYTALIEKSYCLLCEDHQQNIIGMAFLVPRGNPTEIYEANWSYIRFISVSPDQCGKGIGRQLTEKCIEIAKNNHEKVIALHTSEMMQPARHIYESLGFKIVKELAPRLGKRYWLYKLNI